MAVLAAVISCLFVCSHEQGRPGQAFSESARFSGHTLPVRSLTYSPDSGRLASGGDDGCVILWDILRGTEKVLPGEPGRKVRSLAFSPDGAILAAAYDCAPPRVILWDVAKGTEHARIETRSFRATRLAFSPDATMLAIGCDDSTIRLWDLSAGQVCATLLGHGGSITSLRYAPDGRTLASACAGGLVKLWDITHHEVRERIGQRAHSGPVLSLAFSSDGSVLASGGASDGIRLWEVETGRERTRVSTEGQNVSALEFSADRQTLIVAIPTAVLQLSNVADGRKEATVKGQSSLDCCAAISPSSRYVARGGDDAIVRVWDLDGLTGQ
jgi:WD40 repeat protein